MIISVCSFYLTSFAWHVLSAFAFDTHDKPITHFQSESNTQKHDERNDNAPQDDLRLVAQESTRDGADERSD